MLDFSLTSFGVPIASRDVAEAVSAIAGNDVQCIPVEHALPVNKYPCEIDRMA